eukprot:356443-Chlamydomonas_euryale.AAC.8
MSCGVALERALQSPPARRSMKQETHTRVLRAGQYPDTTRALPGVGRPAVVNRPLPGSADAFERITWTSPNLFWLRRDAS